MYVVFGDEEKVWILKRRKLIIQKLSDRIIFLCMLSSHFLFFLVLEATQINSSKHDIHVHIDTKQSLRGNTAFKDNTTIL